MDPAVSLVQAYLYSNGYLTVAEYPIIESFRPGEYRSATDVDLLAVRFPGVERFIPAHGPDGESRRVPLSDPALSNSDDEIEFMIAEVKEGRAVLNSGATNPGVLRTALIRFGAFQPEIVDDLVRDLQRRGEARSPRGFRIRLFSFGSLPPSRKPRRYTVITLEQVVRYLHCFAERYQELVGVANFKDPAFGMLMVLEKAGYARMAHAVTAAARKGDGPPQRAR